MCVLSLSSFFSLFKGFADCDVQVPSLDGRILHLSFVLHLRLLPPQPHISFATEPSKLDGATVLVDSLPFELVRSSGWLRL